MDAPPRPLGAIGAATVAWLALYGALVGWVAIEPGAVDLAACAAPALLALRLALTSQADRGQYVVRLLACAGFTPALLLMIEAERDRLSGALPITGLALLDIAVFLLAVLWLAACATRVDAAPGATVVPVATLEARLRSLAPLGLALQLQPGDGAGAWRITITTCEEPQRSHHLLLDIDAAARIVRVRERLGVSGAAPLDADEASMRTPGEPALDAARPNAQRMSSRVAQTTMIEPAQLAAVELRWSPDGLASAEAGGRDATSMVLLVAALVTRSGYGWRPMMFARRTVPTSPAAPKPSRA